MMADRRAERGSLPVVFRVEFAILWTAASVVSLSLYLIVPGSAWQNSLLPLPSRIGLAGFELVALAGVVIPVAVALSLYTARVHGSGVPRPARWAATGAGLVIAWILAFGYLASWATLRATGRFLDPVTFALVRANAAQMIQHAAHTDPILVIVAPLAALLVALLTVGLLPRLALRVHRRVAQRASILAIAALMACTAAGWAGGRYTVPQMYRIDGLARAGPLTGLALHLATRLADRSDPIRRAERVSLRQRPIVTMERYLAGADTSALNGWNVIVVVVESLRSDQLRLTGGWRNVMPTVDSIAGQSVVFTHNYTQSSHSDYADLAILSSNYPLRSPRYHIYPENPTYPRVLVYDLLKALGYRVGVFSSQNENWSGMIHYLQTGSIDRLLHAETYEGPTQVPRDDPDFYRFVRGSKRSGKIDDRFTVSEAIAWLDSVKPQPFFIYLNLQSSHVPYDVPADFPVRFGSGEVSFPLSFGYFPPDSAEAVMDMYANSLAYVDHQLGRLVGHLRDEGLWENTVIVVTGDTGQGFFEHGFAGHANALYNEVMRVPLVVRAPGLEARVDGRLAQHVDVPPSLAYLLGLPPHPSFQGRNLFAETSQDARYAYLVAQAAAHQYAVVDGRHKLIYDASTGEHLLYDLASDPGETQELSASAPALVRELARRLHAWRRAQLDYYADWRLHGEWYPPVLPDSL